MNALTKTQNPEWGFYGTATRNNYKNVDGLWHSMIVLLCKLYELKPVHARAFLDSTYGRHLADELSFIEGEINPASAQDHFVELLGRHHGWRDYFRKGIIETR